MGFITIDTADIDSQEDMARALRFAIESTFDPGDTRIFSDDDNDVNDDEKAVVPNSTSFRVADSRGNGTWRIMVTDAECEGTPIRVTREGRGAVRRVLAAADKLGREAAAEILEGVADPDAIRRGAVRTLLQLARDLDVDRAVKILVDALSADLHAEEAADEDDLGHCGHCGDLIQPDDAKATGGHCGRCVGCDHVATDDEMVLIGLARKVGTAEAVAALATSVAETLALREDVPDEEVDAIRAVEREYLRRRNA